MNLLYGKLNEEVEDDAESISFERPIVVPYHHNNGNTAVVSFSGDSKKLDI